MAPDFETVKRAGGVVTHLLSSPSGEYAMYVDGEGPSEITMKLPAGRYSATWVDVISGKRKDAGSFQHAGGERSLTSPQFKNGIALRITKNQESKN
jgi:hypothetical protein